MTLVENINQNIYAHIILKVDNQQVILKKWALSVERLHLFTHLTCTTKFPFTCPTCSSHTQVMA